MTTGQLLFYGGAGLLILTILLAIIFIVKKPKYKPESVDYDRASSDTKTLLNGYPTDPLTIRRDTPAESAEPPLPETERLPNEQRAVGIEKAANETAPLANETERLGVTTTEVLSDDPHEGTTLLS